MRGPDHGEEYIGREHVEIAADDERVREIRHAFDEPDQEGIGEARADQRPGDGAEDAPPAAAQGLRGLLHARAHALQHAEQHEIGDRREGEHLRDGDARHAVDPARARDVEPVGKPGRHQAGAPEQQDQREADDERRGDDRQHRERPQERLERQLRAQCDQREGKPEQRRQHAHQHGLGERVPRDPAGPATGHAVEAPDRGARDLLGEEGRHEMSVIVAHRGGEHAEHGIEHEDEHAAGDEQDRAHHECVALAGTAPRQADRAGTEQAAGERNRAPAKRGLHGGRAEPCGEELVVPAVHAERQRLQHEREQAQHGRRDQRAVARRQRASSAASSTGKGASHACCHDCTSNGAALPESSAYHGRSSTPAQPRARQASRLRGTGLTGAAFFTSLVQRSSRCRRTARIRIW